MKLTSWELERVLEALDMLIDERVENEKGTSSLYRLRNKYVSWAQKTGKIHA